MGQHKFLQENLQEDWFRIWLGERYEKNYALRECLLKCISSSIVYSDVHTELCVLITSPRCGTRGPFMRSCLFFFLYVYNFTCMYVCASYVPGAKAVRRGHQILWVRWLWTTLQVLGIETWFSGRITSALNHGDNFLVPILIVFGFVFEGAVNLSPLVRLAKGLLILTICLRELTLCFVLFCQSLSYCLSWSH